MEVEPVSFKQNITDFYEFNSNSPTVKFCKTTNYISASSSFTFITYNIYNDGSLVVSQIIKMNPAYLYLCIQIQAKCLNDDVEMLAW